MAPAGKPDPYRIDEGAARAHQAAGARPIDPSFDVLMRRGIHVVTLLKAQMLDAHEIEQVGTELTKYLGKEHGAKVILDMHGVQHMSSAALGFLLELKATIEGKGGKMCLASLRDDLKQIFKITKLDKVLPIKESVDAAAAMM